MFSESPSARKAAGVRPDPPSLRGPAGSERAAVPSQTAAPLTFHCKNCLLDNEEPYCDGCGMNLAPRARNLAVVRDQRWLNLLNDALRDDWSRRA